MTELATRGEALPPKANYKTADDDQYSTTDHR